MNMIRQALAQTKNEITYIRKRRYARRHKIIIQLRDRLGNHMFIYVLYLKLKSLGRDVSIDTVTQKRTRDKSFSKDLLPDAFGIALPEADEDDIAALLDNGNRKSDRLRHRLFGTWKKGVHEFDNYQFDERFLTEKSGYFTGWYQNEEYFRGIENEIRESFTFRGIPESNRAAAEMERSIKNAELPVSIHFRFGDYLKKASLERYGGICTGAYYLSAVEMIIRAFPEHTPTFFIFSDDMPKAVEFVGGLSASLDQELRAVYVDVCSEADSWIDMYLMSLCRHNIIANSTFSWWAARLNPRPEKIVVSPELWIRLEGRTYPAIRMENAVYIDAKGNRCS